MFSDHAGVTLGLTSGKVSGKSPNICKPNNLHLPFLRRKKPKGQLNILLNRMEVKRQRVKNVSVNALLGERAIAPNLSPCRRSHVSSI